MLQSECHSCNYKGNREAMNEHRYQCLSQRRDAAQKNRSNAEREEQMQIETRQQVSEVPDPIMKRETRSTTKKQKKETKMQTKQEKKNKTKGQNKSKPKPKPKTKTNTTKPGIPAIFCPNCHEHFSNHQCYRTHALQCRVNYLNVEQSESEDSQQQVDGSPSVSEQPIQNNHYVPLTFSNLSTLYLAEEHKQCVICMSEYKNDEELMVLPCIHRFHSECSESWLKTNFKCPVCLHDVRKTS